MKKFEYKVVDLTYKNILDQEGQKGWELCGVNKTLGYLKREVEVSQDQVAILLPILEQFVKTGDIIYPEELTIPANWIPVVKVDSSVDFSETFYDLEEFEEKVLVALSLTYGQIEQFYATKNAAIKASKGRFFKVPTKEGYISETVKVKPKKSNEYGKYSNWNYIEITDSFCIIECF